MRRKAFLNLGVLASAGLVSLGRRAASAQPGPVPAPAPAPSPVVIPGAPVPSQQIQGPAADPATNAVLSAAVNQQFIPMKDTLYQHAPAINTTAQTYYYDCVGFVTYTLELGAPNAYAEINAGLNIRKGFIPSSALYVQWISGLPTAPRAGWQMVPTMAALQPGDMLAWPLEGNNPGTSATGHAVIAAGPALPLADGSYALLVYDSTATPHGPFDTRRTDPRCQPLEIQGSSAFGHLSGLGSGTLQFKVDATGAPIAVAWTVGTAAMATSIVIGRGLA